MSNAKTEALDKIVALAEEHEITADEIGARLTHQRTPDKQNTIVKTLFGYVGGIFVFAGIGLLIGMMWDDMGSAQRVISTLGVGIIAFVMGITTHKDARFTKASTPLLLVSGLMQPTGMFIFLDEYYPHGGDAQLAAILIFTVMVVQQGAAFTVLKRPSLLFLSMIFWGSVLSLVMDRLNVDGELIGLAVGTSLLLITYNTDKTPHRSIVPFWYFISGGILLCAYWNLVEGSFLDLSYLALNGFFIYLSIRLASRALLFVSVLGLFSYLSYFTYEYFADIIGWPIALIVMGLGMIGLSAYAFKLGQKIGNK